MLQQTRSITIRDALPDTESGPPSCELVINDRPSGHRVKGCILEAALQYDTGYLVFLTDDIMFENSLSIHLVDFSGATMDCARIGYIYATGFFENMEMHQPDKVTFIFFGDEIWTLHILQKPTWRIPFITESWAVQRPLGFKRLFTIAGIRINTGLPF